MATQGRRSIGAAAVILDDARGVLLVRHTYGHLNWELPGGISEPGESVVATVIREVSEETGLTVSVGRLTGVYYERDSDIHHFVFECRPQGVGPAEASSPEISECGYWAPDSFPRPISDFTMNRVRDALLSEPLERVTEVPRRSWLR